MLVIQLLLWIAIGVVIYTFFGYALLLGLLARFFSRPVKQAEITPSVALFIPAYNEEAVIAAKIQNSLALDYPPDALEIVLVTDGSNDRTLEIAEQYRSEGVKIFHQPQRRGKIAAVNRVMPKITQEIVIFSDANAMLDAGVVKAIARNFADPEVGGVAGEKRVLSGGEGLYWRYESFLKRCDSALSSVMGAAGELFAIRREVFAAPETDSIIEDFVMSMRLVGQGWRVVYEPQAIVREEASPSLRGDWQRRIRIAAGGFQSIVRLPQLLNPALGRIAWQYVSHRVLRWAITPFLLPLIYLLNLLILSIPIYRWLLAGQTLFYAAALLGYALALKGKRRGILYAAFYFCFSNAAALFGFWRYITNSQPVTWVKVR